MLTANVEALRHDPDLQKNLNGIVGKPCRIETLREAIAHAIAGNACRPVHQARSHSLLIQQPFQQPLYDRHRNSEAKAAPPATATEVGAGAPEPRVRGWGVIRGCQGGWCRCGRFLTIASSASSGGLATCAGIPRSSGSSRGHGPVTHLPSFTEWTGMNSHCQSWTPTGDAARCVFPS